MDEFDKRISLVCVATGLKEEEEHEVRSKTSLSLPDWFTTIYSDTRDMVQNVPLPPLTGSDGPPVVMVATLPTGADPESVTVTLYDGTPTMKTMELPVNAYGSSPIEGLNVFLRDDENGIYSVYVYSYSSSTAYLIDSQIQIRYKVQF